MDIFYHYVEPIVHWLHLHPHWAGIFTFLISFGESLAIIGTIVPGTVTMTAIGVLIGSGVIPMYSTFAWAVLGAVAGDSGSYFLGYYYHMQIIEYWPFRKYPNIITKGKSFFILHGGKSVFFGRFIGPIRAIIPVIAGIMHMPNSRFLLANVSSAFFWALLYIAPGVLIGAATSELSAEVATKFLLYIFVGLIGIWLITWLIKVLVITLKNLTIKHLTQFWAWLKTHPKLQAVALWLSDPTAPHSLNQLYLSLFAFISFLAFIVVATSAYHHGFITHYNNSFFYLIQSLRFPALDKVMTSLSLFGDKLNILPLSLIVTFYLFHKGNRLAAIHLFSVTIITALSIHFIKHGIAFPRPTGLISIREGYSFPSGHVGITFPVIAFIAFLISKQTTFSMKRFIWYPTICFFLLLGFSRLYAGAHWISDLMGAVTLAVFILLAHIVSYQRKPGSTISIPHLATLSFILFLAGGILLNYFLFTQTLMNNQLKQPIKTIQLATWWDEEKNLFPLYRTNRLGKPINIINLQWAAPLTQIKSVLSSNGWESRDALSVSQTLSNLMTKSAINRPPILQPLYRNQHPVLTMTFETKDNRLLLLNLWPSLYHFEEAKIPLWVGSLYQRKFDKHHGRFLEHALIQNISLSDPETVLSDSLKYFVTKKMTVKEQKGYILLIMQR